MISSSTWLLCIVIIYQMIPMGTAQRNSSSLHQSAAVHTNSTRNSTIKPSVTSGDDHPAVYNGYIVSDRTQYNFAARLELQTSTGSTGYCSGSLVSSQHVLTAAHCLVESQTSSGNTLYSVTVYLGDLKVSVDNEDHEVVIKASGVYPHPQYIDSYDPDPNDIGLVRLQSPVVTSNWIRPIALAPTGYKINDGSYENAQVVGWGAYQSTVIEVSDDLRSGLFTIYPGTYSRCLASDGNKQFCAMPITQGQNTLPCPGDSGAPIFETWGSTPTQVAVHSYGIPGGTCSSERMSGSVQVAPFRSWINTYLGISEGTTSKKLLLRRFLLGLFDWNRFG